MPRIAPSPAALVARFDAVAARHPEAQRRTMFGCAALFVGDRYATGLFEDRWVVRLGAADAGALLAVEGSGAFSPMPGRRPMAGWVMLPRAVVEDDEALEPWLRRAIAFAASRPTAT